MSKDQMDSADLQEAANELAQPSTKADAGSSESVFFLKKWAPLIEVFARILTVGIFGLALLQYWDAGIERKQVRSLSLVDEWVDKGFPARLANLNEYIFSTVDENRKEIELLPEEMMQKAWENSDEAMFRSLANPETQGLKDLRSDIDAIFTFFARANICIISDICNIKVIDAYFHSEVISIFEEFRPLIIYMREKGFKAYAQGLEELYIKLNGDA